MKFLLLFLCAGCLFSVIDSSEDEERLMVDVFRGYNPLIQPLKNASDAPMIVKMALQLVLLINVDERDQIMHTNVWLTIKWHDFQMKWNPVDYGEIQQIRVSPDKVWLPDIVLFNNADGNFEVSFMCNVVINHLGEMLWVPPAIYKSSCIIDVEYFPFDEQACTLIFGSWTYNEKEIKMQFDTVELMDLAFYSTSSIWDVMDAPASLTNKRSKIEFQIRIRRKTLFYFVVLIIPTILMAFLNISVFFLPTDSTEKITLTVAILLSIVFFLLLVTKILPPTSSTIPLLAKYLLLTLVLNTITIFMTIIVINLYYRSPKTQPMPKWVRILFLEIMPHLVCMQRPKSAIQQLRQAQAKKSMTQLPGLGQFTLNPALHHPYCSVADERNVSGRVLNSIPEVRDPTTAAFYPLSADAIKAIDAIEYITDHLKKEEEFKTIKPGKNLTENNSKVVDTIFSQRDDWKYVAMIVDRLLLCMFFGITLGGTLGILLSAPNVFEDVDHDAQLKKLVEIYKAGSINA